MKGVGFRVAFMAPERGFYLWSQEEYYKGNMQE